MNWINILIGFGLIYIIPPLIYKDIKFQKDGSRTGESRPVIYLIDMISSIIGILYITSVVDNYFLKALLCFSILVILLSVSALITNIQNYLTEISPSFGKFNTNYHKDFTNPKYAFYRFFDRLANPIFDSSLEYGIYKIVSIFLLTSIFISIGSLQVLTQRQNTVGGRR
jgi:hypothetical protein